MRASRHRETVAAICLLAERFPEAFSMAARRRKPLKVGIDQDIRAALGDATPKRLWFALCAYTSSFSATCKPVAWLVCGASALMANPAAR